jgi:hypothetical protein
MSSDERWKRTALHAGLVPLLTIGVIYAVARSLLIWVPVVGVVFAAVAAGARSATEMRVVFLCGGGLLVQSVLVIAFLPLLP